MRIPRDHRIDSTLAFARDGYLFISKTCRRLETDIFETRLLLQPTICMLGEDAAKLFYDERYFQRAGAAPGRMQATLTGRGGVQGLDNAEHRHRKAMFMSLMTPERIRSLGELVREELGVAATRWQREPRIVLFDELQLVLSRAVCRWAGVPVSDDEHPRRTSDIVDLIEGAGAIGLRHWRARWSRRRCEGWLAPVVEAVRAGRLVAGQATALHVIATHRTPSGELLPPRVAAVELLNVLRPTIAIATFITFAALALHEYPASRRALEAGDPGALEAFVQEVRRFYPFFPAAVARIREDFEWRGLELRQGRRVLLDLYGTDHDPRIWDAPEEFRPERFRTESPGAFRFVPQGGGDHHAHHRCAGESITIEVMKVAVAFLLSISYRVPEQDLRLYAHRMPTRPRSGFVIEDVKLALELVPEPPRALPRSTIARP